jgi:hypothetical protein
MFSLNIFNIICLHCVDIIPIPQFNYHLTTLFESTSPEFFRGFLYCSQILLIKSVDHYWTSIEKLQTRINPFYICPISTLYIIISTPTLYQFVVYGRFSITSFPIIKVSLYFYSLLWNIKILVFSWVSLFQDIHN